MENSIEANDDEGEILGSVTHNVDSQNTDKAPLRTSARVSKKLRLDSQNATNNQEKPLDKKNASDKADVKNNEQKPSTSKRINGLWSAEDKNVFFKALNEYGKDFLAIQTHMNNKRKKRGFSQNMTKNKDQARHFYYRTCHKISKYVKFPPDVNKVTQELYTLVNFGEFRKRMGFFTEKYAIKLNELIYLGFTQIRVKGKTLRIKTPVCRALRKLNQLEEYPGDIQSPVRILIELRPRDNFTWSKIQALSMNPRVRTILPSHTRLLSLLEFLQQKWQTPEMKKVKIPSSMSNNDATDNQALEECTALLRVAPKEGLNITAPVISSGEFITSSRICFLSYEKKFLNRTTNVEEMLKQLNLNISRGGKQQKSAKKHVTEEDKGKSKIESQEPENVQAETDVSPAVFQKTVTTVQKSVKKDAINEDKEKLKFDYNDHDGLQFDNDFSAVLFQQPSTLSNKETDLSINCVKDETECEMNAENEDYDNDPAPEIFDSEKEQILKAKAGWTIKNADTVRIGDLYLMFGNDSRLQLEYWWEDSSAEQNNDAISSILQKLISVAQTILDKEKVHCRGGGNVYKDNNRRCANSKKLDSKSYKTSSTDYLHNTACDTTKSLETVQLPTDNSGGHDNKAHKESGTESFREQLSKLQPHYLGRRRRPGDRQTSVVPRMLTTFSTQPQNVQSGLVSHRNNYNSNNNNNNNRKNSANVKESKITDVDIPDLPNNTDVNKGDAYAASLMNNVDSSRVSTAAISIPPEFDEDTRLSNCSSLTRFLSNIVIPSADDNGLASPPKTSAGNISISELLNSSNADWIQSSQWSGLESSNLSYSSLLANLDHSAVQLNGSMKLEDDNASIANSVESSASSSSFPLNLSTALFNTNIPSVAK